jgi:chemotaxis protein CheD
MKHCVDAMKTVSESNNQQGHAAAQEADARLPLIYLHPGALYASAEPASLSTIVGSCVAVCVFNPRLRMGGATHYLLPTLEGPGLPSPRYGDVAISELLSGLMQAGSKKEDLQAQVYGGACSLHAFRDGPSELIGDKNVRLALRVLLRERIPVVQRETGGDKGRMVSMRTDTGATSFKLIGT